MVKWVNNLSALITDRQNIRLCLAQSHQRQTKGRRRAQLSERFFNEYRTGCVSASCLPTRAGESIEAFVRDPKPRVINAAALPERIMHHAIMNILEPVFEWFQVFHSYACRKGKGTHAAVLHAFRQTKKSGSILNSMCANILILSITEY